MMAQDCDTTVATLRAQVAAFVAARDWQQFHSGKNLAMSIAIEAAELMEHFQWAPPADGTINKAEVAEELADVLIYAMSFANTLDIDISAAITAKLAKNETRFPVPAGTLPHPESSR
ncbi:nucleotide pyrophosphohydrolase [Chitinimonas sp. BJYL2]|uniref:nucleotide pyrophosphohydrolase n=1 Tax=Chitinimonas sp. BJYL2 TaxID=2976696 RepID=UPI0022B2D074|nr:nucleotide pyrophosphohydrolase [Chitinimonas sp. BJYL2]